jgi:hypothetical protein
VTTLSEEAVESSKKRAGGMCFSGIGLTSAQGQTRIASFQRLKQTQKETRRQVIQRRVLQSFLASFF